MKAFTISVFLAGGLSCLADPTFTFQFVNYPGDTFTQLLGINNSGTIAGYHGAAINSGFTLTLPSTFTTENYPGAVQTQVVGINSAGDTVGFYIDSAGNQHAFLHTKAGDVFSTHDNPASTQVNQFLGFNDNGVAAGYWGNLAATTQVAETWDGTTQTFTDLTIPGSPPISQATDINNNSWISGFFTDASGNTHGFLTRGATFTQLDDPLAPKTTAALGLNNSNEVVGFYNDSGGNANGFVYMGGMFETVDVPGASMTTINGVNDKGQIVGFFLDANGNTVGFVGTPTPEPASFVMAGLGTLALGLLKICRRRAV